MDVVASCAEGARCVGFVSSESVGSVLPLFGLVAGEVELDEEQQVRVDDAQTDLVTPRVVERGTVALPQVVPSDRDGVKRVDEDELDDLQTSDVLLPPDLLLQAGQEVVVIHEDVDEAVEQLSAPLDGDEVLEAVPHEEHRHPMVVHMKERELVLLQAHEGGIGPLVVFAEVEDIDPEVERTLAHLLRSMVAEQGLSTVPLQIPKREVAMPMNMMREPKVMMKL